MSDPGRWLYENVAVLPHAVDSSAMLGRQEQLKGIESFLARAVPNRALVLVGEAGIGKTTLWRAGIRLARDRGLRVLSARASETETSLSFASVGDLLDGVDLSLPGGLPQPQRQALEVALRRVAPADAPPEPYAIVAGLLSAIRNLAETQPLLLALDDVGSVDRPSANALAYAIRRLEGASVLFMFSRRTGRPSELERAFAPEDTKTLEVGPLSFGAISHLLTEGLARSFPRRVLRQIFETAQGNPLFAYELGRTLVDRGVPEIGGDLPVPDVLEDLFRAEVANLPPSVRRALLAVALSGELSRTELSAVVDQPSMDEALSAGVLVDEASRVRASHPLRAAAARRQSSPAERRDLHRDLASAVADTVLRARHLALAASGPDPEVAATVAAAAEIASRRGGARDAVDLARHALSLTPPGVAGRVVRVLTLARYLQIAGDTAQVTRLLNANLESFPHGAARAEAHLLFADSPDYETKFLHVESALRESVNDPTLRARVLVRLSALQTLSQISRIADAEKLAEQAIVIAPTDDLETMRLGLVGVAWARILQGERIDDLVGRIPKSPLASSMLEASIERPAGVQLAFRGEIDRARAMLSREIAEADERGEARSAVALHAQLCELALRAGDAHEASRLLAEWDHWAGTIEHEVPFMKVRLEALLAAIRGAPTEARRLATAVIGPGGAGEGDVWDRLEASRAYGIACLFEHDAKHAVANFRSVWDHTVREGVTDPGAFPVAGDLVEALVEVHEVAAAREVAESLGRRADEQVHPWGLAAYDRSFALLRLADGYDFHAAGALDSAAAEFGRLGLKFDRARTLLLLGNLLRRFKKRADARQALDAAAQAFEDSGCSGWADRSRSDLARVSGRRSADESRLTESEQRVASLAARGLSNKEIANRLFVTVYTVEAHLSHAYAKLGVRSRAQLVHRLTNTP